MTGRGDRATATGGTPCADDGRPCDSVARVKRVAAGLVVLAWAGAARAQIAAPAPDAIPVGDWKLAPVVEARVRGEGRADVDGNDHGELLERVRLGADAWRGPVEVRVVLQDARLWDLGAGTAGVGQPSSLAQTGAYEAWVDAHTASARPSFLRVGRQAVTWGEGRLLGASDASPTGRSLDAVRGRLVVGDWAFEALGASLSDPVNNQAAPVPPAYGELVGARVEWGFDPLLAVDAYGLGRFAQAQPAENLEGTVQGETYTGALYLHGDAHSIAWGAEGAVQLGHVSGLALDRLAWAGAGHVAYSFDRVVLSPTLRLGGSYASGPEAGSKYTAFDPMLPDARAFYGAMDLFAWSNIVEGHARVTVVPWTDAVASVEYRYARLAQAGGPWRTDYLVTVAPATGNTQAELGNEVDVALRWAPWEPLELAAGYSLLALGSGAKALLAEERVTAPDVAHFGFGQATVRLP